MEKALLDIDSDVMNLSSTKQQQTKKMKNKQRMKKNTKTPQETQTSYVVLSLWALLLSSSSFFGTVGI